MDTRSGLEVALLATLLGLSAFFSLCEASLTSINRLRLKKLRDNGIKGADTVSKVLERPERMFSTILIGGNLVDISTTSLATALAIRHFGNTVAVVIWATLATTVLIVILGEVTPKTLAVLYPESIGLRLSGAVRLLTIAFTPLVAVLNRTTLLILRLLGANPNINKDEITEQDLRAIIDIGHEQGVIEQKARDMFANVFEFSASTAFDVMTPRTDIRAVSTGATAEQVRQAFEQDKYSRMPVYEENIDNIIGVIHLKDFVFPEAFSDKEPGAWLSSIMRRPHFTYDNQPIGQLFSLMREKRSPFAVVLDEYGGTSGIVTLEDIVAKIVGAMGDEYEDDEYCAQPVSENEFLVDGSTILEDANAIMGTALESEEFESVGGYVIGKLGRIPEIGASFEYAGLCFTVTAMDKNRILEILIRKLY